MICNATLQRIAGNVIDTASIADLRAYPTGDSDAARRVNRMIWERVEAEDVIPLFEAHRRIGDMIKNSVLHVQMQP